MLLKVLEKISPLSFAQTNVRTSVNENTKSQKISSRLFVDTYVDALSEKCTFE